MLAIATIPHSVFFFMKKCFKKICDKKVLWKIWFTESASDKNFTSNSQNIQSFHQQTYKKIIVSTFKIKAFCTYIRYALYYSLYKYLFKVIVVNSPVKIELGMAHVGRLGL